MTSEALAVREVAFDSPEYWSCLLLRYHVLRAPLGLVYSPEQVEAEAEETGLAIFDGDRPIAVLMLKGLDADRCQMRQVAVAADHQSKGLGRRLVQSFEELAEICGYRLIEVHARDSALDFYLGLGYSVVGEPFEEVGLPHHHVQKRLG